MNSEINSLEEITTTRLFDSNLKDVSEESKSCIKILDKGVVSASKTFKGKSFYFLRANSSRIFYNPYGFPSESILNEKHLGQDRWRYIEVKKEVFDLYKQFLSTRNELFLRQAQRRFENE